MADLILRLRVDPATGKRELVIDYTSDADALPIEHEDAHRQLADKVVDGGLAQRQGRGHARGRSRRSTEASRAAEAAPVAQPTADDGEPWRSGSAIARRCRWC